MLSDILEVLHYKCHSCLFAGVPLRGVTKQWAVGPIDKMTTDISVVRSGWDPTLQQEIVDEYEYDGGNSSSRLFERSRIKALAGEWIFKICNYNRRISLHCNRRVNVFKTWFYIKYTLIFDGSKEVFYITNASFVFFSPSFANATK